MIRLFTLTSFATWALIACTSSTDEAAKARAEADAAADDDGPGDEDAGETILDIHAIPPDASAGAAMCVELGSKCHPFDHNDGALGDRCHNVGHLGKVDECAAMYDKCIDFCQEPVDAGDEHEHGDVQCETLARACDQPAESGGRAEACHEIGHGDDAHECAEVYDECLALCSGDAGDGGS